MGCSDSIEGHLGAAYVEAGELSCGFLVEKIAVGDYRCMIGYAERFEFFSKALDAVEFKQRFASEPCDA